MPDHADRTSSRVAGTLRYGASASKMKSTSSAVARGRSVTGARASVVPAMTPPSQGEHEHHAPVLRLRHDEALVLRREVRGEGDVGASAGVTIGALVASDIDRTPSENGPVAFSTHFARTSNSPPLERVSPSTTSRTFAPMTLPLAGSLRSFVTLA